MVDSLLFSLLLTTLGAQLDTLDPNPFTPENEKLVEMLSRADYALTWYSTGGKLDERGETYIQLGPPLFPPVKEEVPRDDLHQGYGHGKPKEELVIQETWHYAHLPKPLVFQPDKTGEDVCLRRPEQWMQMARAVYSEPVSYHYDYGKENLHCHITINIWWTYPQRFDYKDVELELTLPVEGLDSGCIWQVLFQDSTRNELRRDSVFVDFSDSLPALKPGTS